MCGISGLVTGPDSRINYANWVRPSIYVGTLRGAHASGVGVAPLEGGAQTFKSPVPGDLVVDTMAFNNFVSTHLPLVAKVRAAMVHNRHATRGSRGVDAAHPFKIGHITMVHNGTLDTTDWQKNGFISDSHYLVNLVANSKDEYARDVFGEVEGAFACIWYNENTKSVYFVRNSERPLYYSEIDEGNDGIILASEAWMMDAGLRDQNFNYELTPIECEENKIYSLNTSAVYDRANKRANVMCVPYVPKERPVYTNNYYTNPQAQYYGFQNYGKVASPPLAPAAPPATSPATKTTGAVTSLTVVTSGKKGNRLWTGECLGHTFPIDVTDWERDALDEIMDAAFSQLIVPGKPKPQAFSPKKITHGGRTLMAGANSMFVLTQAFRNKETPENITFRGFMLTDGFADALNPSVLCSFVYNKQAMEKQPNRGLLLPQDAEDYFADLEKDTTDARLPIIDACVKTILAYPGPELLVCYLDPATVETTCTFGDMLTEAFH